MYPAGRPSGIDKLSTVSIRLGIVVLVGYLAITALGGFQVGRQIYAAKSNPFVGLGSALIGRDATESFAIKQMHIPAWVTDSPTFWIALRMAE